MKEPKPSPQPYCLDIGSSIDQLHVVEFIIFFLKAHNFQNFWAMSFKKKHWLTSYQNIYSNISFPKAVNKTCPCGVTIFTSHHKVITSSRSLQTRLLHQGVSRLLRHDDVDQSQTVSKSGDFRCEKKCIFAHWRVVRVGYSESARWKLSF